MTSLKPLKTAGHEEEIILGYKAGSTLDNLATFHNVSKGTIRNLLISSGVELRSRGKRRKETANGTN